MPMDYMFKFYAGTGQLLLQMTVRCENHPAAMAISKRYMPANASLCEIWEGERLMSDPHSDRVLFQGKKDGSATG
jgi:hypothetical protein